MCLTGVRHEAVNYLCYGRLVTMNDNEEKGAKASQSRAIPKGTLIDTGEAVSERGATLDSAKATTTTEYNLLHDELPVYQQLQSEHRAVDGGYKRYWDKVGKSESRPRHVSGLEHFRRLLGEVRDITYSKAANSR